MISTETLKKTWRPAMGWALVFINLLYAVVTVALLLAGPVSFGEAIPFMLAQIGQLTILGGAGIVGRSYEKVRGRDGGSDSSAPFVDAELPGKDHT